MPGFEQGDVVRVPFPYTDRGTRQHRPALVVSRKAIGDETALIWVVMITSAENRAWPDDVDLGDAYADAGLPAASVVRTCKIATIEHRYASKLGRLPTAYLDQVSRHLARNIGIG